MTEAAGWERALAVAIAARADRPFAQWIDELRTFVDERAVDHFSATVDREEQNADISGELDGMVPPVLRARRGIYFTPRSLADRMAALVPSEARGHAVDLACGDGALLAALGRTHPHLALRGVEQNPYFAVAAGAEILRLRGEPHSGDRIEWGDGLADHDWASDAAVVIGNPPYVGEKGNKELFRSLRARHEHLTPYFDGRIDLHYLFLHRAVDVLRPGGAMVQLTSEYWLTATRARLLRDHLTRECEITHLERLGAAAFAAAPGHHSLLLAAQRRPSAVISMALPAGGASWTPFAEIEPLEGVALRDVLRDRQGFVSGADRVTHRSSKLVQEPPGTPIFLYDENEIPAGEEDLFGPVLRRSDCVANRVYLEPPPGEAVLWVDGPLEGERLARVTNLLEPFKPILSARREAANGKMPWYRIWWPRVTEEYQQPKLVVPRRAKEAAWCLDLSGAFVSSDCTFLLADATLDPVPTLMAVLLVANDPRVVEHLRHYGKTKGEIIEFYSEPLRALPLPVERVDDRFVPTDRELRARWERAMAIWERVPNTAYFDA